MKTLRYASLITTVVIVAALLSGCSPAKPTPVPGAVLADSYENALSPRNQLLVGTVLLEETGLRVTAEQARTITPLWQALRTLSRSGTTAELEMDALVAQLEAHYSQEQLAAIATKQLTRDDMQALFAELGIRPGSGAGPGGGVGGGHLSDAERAARQATRTATGATPGNGQAGDTGNMALMDYVIELLQARAL